MSYSNAIRGAAVLIGALIAAQSMAATPDEQTVCRYDSRPGSRILSHTCLTQAEWTQIDKRQAATRLLFGGDPAAMGSGGAGVPGNSIVGTSGGSNNWGGFQRGQ